MSPLWGLGLGEHACYTDAAPLGLYPFFPTHFYTSIPAQDTKDTASSKTF